MASTCLSSASGVVSSTCKLLGTYTAANRCHLNSILLVMIMSSSQNGHIAACKLRSERFAPQEVAPSADPYAGKARLELEPLHPQLTPPAMLAASQQAPVAPASGQPRYRLTSITILLSSPSLLPSLPTRLAISVRESVHITVHGLPTPPQLATICTALTIQLHHWICPTYLSYSAHLRISLISGSKRVKGFNHLHRRLLIRNV